MARTPYWDDNLIDLAITSTATIETELMTALSGQQRRGITIVRTIIELGITPSPTSGVVGTQSVDIGIGVIAETASLAGAPDVRVASHRPARGWIMRTRCVVIDDATTVPAMSECKMDLRTKRKVDDGKPFIGIGNSARTGSAFTVHVSGIIRLLYLLP